MDDIRDIVARRVSDLTPAEKRCARVLLADYPAMGLASAASFAEAAGTSAPTVLRFLAHLGFGSYRTFQQRLREEITRAVTSPVQRATRSRVERMAPTDFTAAVDQRIGIAEQLLRTVPQPEFDAAVSLLVGRPRKTLVAGGYFTHHLAALLASQLDQLLTGVDFTRDPLRSDIGKYLDLGKDGVVLLFDFRRYEMAAKQLAELVKKRGAHLIVLTDQELSPSAQLADVVLPVHVDGVPFDSDAGVVILLESLVECVFNALGQKAIRRMERWEDNVEIPRVFAATEPDPPAES
ncbi:MurR/RpiR family transcriptional regulator [Actinocatenispora sera]|uniref:MurR/RpiR family transcriptional regulator n=1 Tax=Actinocatenispora sera TaxID=390989 RepID=UPI0033F0394A